MSGLDVRGDFRRVDSRGKELAQRSVVEERGRAFGSQAAAAEAREKLGAVARDRRQVGA
jgi:hypothetical protein